MKKKFINTLEKRWTNLKFYTFMLGLILSFQLSLASDNPGLNWQDDVKVITGTVTDKSNNDPLPGVSIVIQGTTKGTITDFDGNYTISASSADVLIFSFVGYLEQQIKVESQSVINITMEADVVGLDEVVVIGYGTQKKKLNTGATLSIGGDDIQQLNTTGTMDALKGLSPGVSITQNNGMPGAGNKIFIRGIGTTGNYEPLYIVDGVAVGNIDNLSPSDIETLDVLKDAASAAIYGSRGANGVVLVTTKKGIKNSAPVVNYSGYYGVQNVYKRPELLNAQQYIEILNEAAVNAEKTPYNYASLIPNYDKIESGEWEGTNWFEAIEEKNAPVQSHALNISGGSETSVFSIGASYLDHQGILGKQVNNDYKRINLRLNSEHILLKMGGHNLLTFGENFTYTNTKNPTLRTGSIYWSDVHNMMVASPVLPIYAEDVEDPSYPYHHSIAWDPNESNPIAAMELQSKYNTNNNNTIIGNAYIELEPIKNLKARSSVGINNWYGSSRHWIPAYNLSNINSFDDDQLTQSMNSGYTWTSTNTLTYNTNILGAHNITLLAGQEALKTAASLSITGHNDSSIFNNYEYAYLDNFVALGDRLSTNARFGGRDDFGWAMLSYFARVSYDYKEKYMATAVMRWDASSNFAKGYRWGKFPSVSAGWVISNEDFMGDVKSWLNFAKLRASWGKNGNQDISRDFVYLSLIELNTSNYFFGPERDQITTGSSPFQVPNPYIEWEKSIQTNIGLDANFLNNRLQFAFDWYQKDTKDWLNEKLSSVMDGTRAPWVNGGLVRNRGIETMIKWSDTRGDFKYSVSGTIAYNKNVVVEIPSADSIIHGPANVLSQGTTEMFRAEVGYPIGYFWGFETDGILQNEQEVADYNWNGVPYFNGSSPSTQQLPGDLRFVDQNDDGRINVDDKVMIGSPHPDFIFGIQVNLEFRGFFMNIAGNGMAGHQIAMNYRSVDSPKQNYTTQIYERWHGEGTSDRMPRLFQGAHRNYQYVSDIYIYDGDFFRISNLTVGYDFKKLSSKIPAKEIKLYVTAKNLHTFTKYPGMDPEVGYSPTDGSNPDNDFPWGSGIDLGLYPQARTFMLGANITF